MTHAENFISVMSSKHPTMQKLTNKVISSRQINRTKLPRAAWPPAWHSTQPKLTPAYRAVTGFSGVWVYSHTRWCKHSRSREGTAANKGHELLAPDPAGIWGNHNLPQKGEVQKLCASGSGLSPEHHSLFQFKPTAKGEGTRKRDQAAA